MPIVAHCPNCGGTDIREKNVAYAQIRVAKWKTGEYGELVPVEWDWDVDAEWSTDEDQSEQYVCRHGTKSGEPCTWEGELHELAIEHEPDDDDA